MRPGVTASYGVLRASTYMDRSRGKQPAQRESCNNCPVQSQQPGPNRLETGDVLPALEVSEDENQGTTDRGCTGNQSHDRYPSNLVALEFMRGQPDQDVTEYQRDESEENDRRVDIYVHLCQPAEGDSHDERQQNRGYEASLYKAATTSRESQVEKRPMGGRIAKREVDVDSSAADLGLSDRPCDARHAGLRLGSGERRCSRGYLKSLRR